MSIDAIRVALQALSQDCYDERTARNRRGAFDAACNPTAIRSLLAALDKAEEDARRLDAIAANPRWQIDCEVLKFGTPGKWRVWSIKGNPHKSTDIRIHGEGDTPREAIDAAMTPKDRA